MSKTRDAQLQVICFTSATAYTKITEELKTNEDFNGNNGDEYLCDEAKKNGYTSNFAYHWNKAYTKKTHNKKIGEKRFDAILQDFFTRLKESDDSYYRTIEYCLTNIGGVLGDYVLSVMYITEE